MAKYINTFSSDEGELKQGRGHKSIIYDQYVQASFVTEEEYNRTSDMVRQSKKGQVQRCKDQGQRMIEFSNVYGTGVYFLMPPYIQPNTSIDEIQSPKTRMLSRGLSNSREGDLFRAICNKITAMNGMESISNLDFNSVRSKADELVAFLQGDLTPRTPGLLPIDPILSVTKRSLEEGVH